LGKKLAKYDPAPVTLTHYPSQLCSHDPTSATINSTTTNSKKPKKEKKVVRFFLEKQQKSN